MKNAASGLFVCPTTGFHTRIVPQIAGILCRILLVVFLASLFLVAGCSDDEVDVTFPTPPQPSSKLWLYDVFGTTETDTEGNIISNVFACGYGGSMVHFDGETWTQVDMNTSHNIVSIWGPGDGTLYACGFGGSIWRNSGTGWSNMDSGTDSYLVGLGSFNNDIHVCGVDGALRQLSGNTWEDTKTVMILRDPVGAPLDTLSRSIDIESLVTINHYFIGGAYRLPSYDEDENIGTEYTDGMVLGKDISFPEQPQFDWHLRPLRADEIVPSEWIQCSTSDSSGLVGNNYLGTTEGWVFQLSDSQMTGLTWVKVHPRITTDPRAGINDMWLDELGNLFMVTHSGQVVFQSHDYKYNETGFRVVQQITSGSLMGLWGEDSDNLFAVGLIEKTVFRLRYDFTERIFEVSEDLLPFIEKSPVGGDNLDKFGRPLTW
ncbi:MAG: hypothetical protein KOO60_11650 [Gemmatimonadales bacterium]|nr:hypothetical protein [Gemmatimonadales bacterium]